MLGLSRWFSESSQQIINKKHEKEGKGREGFVWLEIETAPDQFPDPTLVPPNQTDTKQF